MIMIGETALAEQRRFWAYWLLRALAAMPADDAARAAAANDLALVLTNAGFKPGGNTADDVLRSPPTHREPADFQ